MFFLKKFSREKILEAVRHGKQHPNVSQSQSPWKIFSKKNIFTISIIAIVAFLIALICFFGQDLIWIQLVPNSKARIQIVAEIPFEYPSKIKTQRLKEQRRNLVAPVYKIDNAVYESFEEEIFRLDELLDAFSESEQTSEAYRIELQSFVRNFNEKHRANVSWSDVDILIRSIDEYTRTGILVEGLSIVSDILNEGVFDQSLSDQKNEEYFLNIEVEGTVRRARNRSENEAVRFLKLRLSSIEATGEILGAITRILKTGIKPNIVFDNPATARKIAKMQQETPDVIEKIFINTVLVEAGSMVTPEDYECLLAYRKALQAANVSLLHTNNKFTERFFISFLILLLLYLFFCTTRKDLRILTPKETGLVIVLLLLNLLICRCVVWLFELSAFQGIMSFIHLPDGAETTMKLMDPIFLLPYAMPLTFSALLGTLLLRTYVGTLLGVVTSIFCCLMLSQTIEFLIISFAIIFTSVYCVRHSYIRAQVMRSGYWGGGIFALVPLIFFFSDVVSREICLLQMLIGFFNCLFVSMFILTILPFFESLFKCCTNICLVELTDYRNPLLTKLQILAPGTYHHSLMVANLAEQAAISIRANPFLCRTLALYHDIGKLVKPEYFTENQSNKNPHDEKTPFMSALIIKSHVKEGVAIAKAARLPLRIIDGIVEHHGTTVIRYFYSKALKQEEEARLVSGQSVSLPSEIEKSAFKYDGPRPRSKETLILSIADSIEAASRSLYNPTPQSIQTLVHNIIDGKIRERQLDDCLVTFRDIDELRRSFYFTLLNMLHSRINYDGLETQ